jgi:hypothetical protein
LAIAIFIEEAEHTMVADIKTDKSDTTTSSGYSQKKDFSEKQ